MNNEFIIEIKGLPSNVLVDIPIIKIGDQKQTYWVKDLEKRYSDVDGNVLFTVFKKEY